LEFLSLVSLSELFVRLRLDQAMLNYFIVLFFLTLQGLPVRDQEDLRHSHAFHFLFLKLSLHHDIVRVKKQGL
jgi:hypothetical protein